MQLEDERRSVSVSIGLIKPKTLVICIENAYKGRLTLDKNSLPIAKRKITVLDLGLSEIP